MRASRKDLFAFGVFLLILGVVGFLYAYSEVNRVKRQWDYDKPIQEGKSVYFEYSHRRARHLTNTYHTMIKVQYATAFLGVLGVLFIIWAGLSDKDYPLRIYKDDSSQREAHQSISC